MKNRSELREIIMKVIYQVMILKEGKLEVNTKALIHEQLEIENEFINTSVDGILEYEEDIRNMANVYLKDWEINRLNNQKTGNIMKKSLIMMAAIALVGCNGAN